MLLIIDNAKDVREALQDKLFYEFALNTCATSARNTESAFAKHQIDAAFIPNAGTIPNPVGYCRRFKAAHPDIPLIAAIPQDYEGIDPDALYRVTDNIPTTPLPTIRLVEIVLELQRLYTGRDHLALTSGALSISPYALTVLYCGCPIELSANAISILRYLCEAAPRPVPTAELLSETCAPNRQRKPAALRMQIAEINKRSVAVIGTRMISHIVGKGYVIGDRIKAKQ